MGLILSALSSATSTIADQYKEFFYCDAIPANVLAVRGQKKVSGFTNNGNDNVITNGSLINVADGQCMIIVENGQVAEICAEPGQFVYDNTVAPSVLTGSLKESVKQVFAEIGRRFTFGGSPASDQRVYYFNTKEITSNKFGTPSPVPFRVVDRNAGIDMDISLKCFGEYSYHIADPILFYTNVCGNVTEAYTRERLDSQMKSELLSALQPAFAKISDMGIRYSSVIGHTTELCDALNEALAAKWSNTRGIEIVSMNISSLKADDEDEQRIKDMQRAAAYKDPALAAAAALEAQNQAMKDAANNSAGAMTGFMGYGMAQNAGGINVNDLYAKAAASNEIKQPLPAEAAVGSWTCPNCQTVNTGKFCTECGQKKPSAGWICPNCSTENTGKFCTECGTKKPE